MIELYLGDRDSNPDSQIQSLNWFFFWVVLCSLVYTAVVFTASAIMLVYV